MSKTQFEFISRIDPSNSASWEGKVFLTFDVDWAVDEIIADTVDVCRKFGAVITLFATHKSEYLASLTKDGDIEIGLHPDYNPLLWGEPAGKNFRKIATSLKELYPAAKSVRSHSLCFGSLIQTVYAELELSHDSSVIVPWQFNARPLFPWTMWDGLTRVPYFYCDYIGAMNGRAQVAEILARPGLRVFDFHPIHVFLNTESLDRYDQTRGFHRSPERLINERHLGRGSRSELHDLLLAVSKS